MLLLHFLSDGDPKTTVLRGQRRALGGSRSMSARSLCNAPELSRVSELKAAEAVAKPPAEDGAR
jgi:hypothetical protein